MTDERDAIAEVIHEAVNAIVDAIAAQDARVKVLEDRLADVDTILSQFVGGGDVNTDPVEAAFLRARDRARKA